MGDAYGWNSLITKQQSRITNPFNHKSQIANHPWMEL
jgi:hypothetical protein